MIATSEQIPLPFSLFPPSSLIDSKIPTIHSADCSLRPQINRIKLKEEWWGLSRAGFDRSLGNKGEKGVARESKRRRSGRHAVEGSTEETSRSEKTTTRLDSSGSVGGFPRIEKEISSKSQGRPQEPSSTSELFGEHAAASFLSFDSIQARVADQTLPDSSSYRISLRSQSRSPPQSSPHSSFLPLRPATTLLTQSIGSIQTGLGLSDFEPFRTNEPIDPLKSFAFYRLQIEFFTSLSSPNNWSNKPHSSVLNEPDFLPLQAGIMSLQPNLEYIRKPYPLGTSTYRLVPRDKKDWIWGELGDVLDWLYGMRVKMDEILWFVEHAPQPLLAIARFAAITLRYSRGVSRASSDFARFLHEQRSSQQSTKEKRARDLLDWLRTGMSGEKGQRWRNWWGDEVKRDREGRELKGRRWLDEVRGWRIFGDLEKWESDRRAQGKWWMH